MLRASAGVAVARGRRIRSEGAAAVAAAQGGFGCRKGEEQQVIQGRPMQRELGLSRERDSVQSRYGASGPASDPRPCERHQGAHARHAQEPLVAEPGARGAPIRPCDELFAAEEATASAVRGVVDLIGDAEAEAVVSAMQAAETAGGGDAGGAPVRREAEAAEARELLSAAKELRESIAKYQELLAHGVDEQGEEAKKSSLASAVQIALGKIGASTVLYCTEASAAG